MLALPLYSLIPNCTIQFCEWFVDPAMEVSGPEEGRHVMVQEFDEHQLRDQWVVDIKAGRGLAAIEPTFPSDNEVLLTTSLPRGQTLKLENF